MTVILVLITFVAFLVIDHFYSKRHAVQPILVEARASSEQVREPRLQPSVVAGFQVPDNVRYHPGHTWALSESPNLVRVGIDDFAGKLLGKIENLALPQRGQWIRQGQKMLSIERNGVKVDMASPIEGSVTDINEAVVQNPEMARQDPYGEGWLITVQAPDAKTNFRNLLGGVLVSRWMEECAFRLASTMPKSAATMADGGLVSPDLAKQIPSDKYLAIVNEFFLC